MTKEQKINTLRVLIGENENTKRPEPEEVLAVYLDMAGAKILDRMYPYQNNYAELMAKNQQKTTYVAGSTVHTEDSGTEATPETEEEAYPVPDKYAMVQLKIAAYMLNKRGAEGEVQHIENGVHRNYGDADIPETMLNSIPSRVGTFAGR